MARQIRLRDADARKLGLLDPGATRLSPALNTPAQSKPARRPGPKRLTSPAHPGSAAGPESGKRKKAPKKIISVPRVPAAALPPQGTGRVELNVDGTPRAVNLRIDAVPVPKERARVVRTGSNGGIMSYTPQRTSDYSDIVKRVAESVFGSYAPFSGPVEVEISFFMPIPKSWPKWKRQAARDGLIEPTGKPDMDNLEKSFLDALKGLVFEDDSILTRWIVEKLYSDEPGIVARYEGRSKLGIRCRRSEVEALRKSLGADHPAKK